MKLLENIKKDIAVYVEAISKVINADVEVMTKDLIRIAGTGILKEKVGLSMENDSHSYKNAMKTGKLSIISNPRLYSLSRLSFKKYL